MTLPQLIKKAQIVFNKFIRERDKDLPCISCGAYTTLQAGHFYSAGHHSALRFEEDNVHGQCVRCNHFLSGNLVGYQEGLIKRIGHERFDMLKMKADTYKRNRGYKFDRFTLEEIIKRYTSK